MLIRSATGRDRSAILALAPRLQEGVAPWRDPSSVVKAVTGWVKDSLDRLDDPDAATFVAALEGQIVGFISVSEREHFAGQIDAYIGELVVHDR